MCKPTNRCLAFWRFGPQTPAEGLGKLWELLPADTRVPDPASGRTWISASALAGAMLDGDALALLAVSFGPVQDFIVQARSTSDLWAGSHLLSRIAWEGMKVVAERFGPDCVLYPQLRGVPEVDVWLIEQGLGVEWFRGEDWAQLGSEVNPLFAASLPNRFVAIVPEAETRTLAEKITERVHSFVQEQANGALIAAGEDVTVRRGPSSV